MSNQVIWLILIVLQCIITPLPPKQHNADHFLNLQSYALCEEGFHAFLMRVLQVKGAWSKEWSWVFWHAAMAGLPFEHSSKFGIVLQLILHPNRTLLALRMGWVQDRAFLETHPCWLESTSVCTVKHEEMFPDRWVGQVLPGKVPTAWQGGSMGYGGGWAAGS